MFCRVLENKDRGKTRTVKRRKSERAFVLQLGLGGQPLVVKLIAPTMDTKQPELVTLQGARF